LELFADFTLRAKSRVPLPLLTTHSYYHLHKLVAPFSNYRKLHCLLVSLHIFAVVYILFLFAILTVLWPPE